MKKWGLLLVLSSLLLGLTACQRDNAQSSSATHSATAASDQVAHKTVTWQFDTFKITHLKAEVDADDPHEVSVEFDWQNTTQQAKSFADQAVITVSQNGEQLAVLERDDDLTEAIAPQTTDDLETTFRLKKSNQPLTVKVSTRAEPQKTHQTQLKLAPTADD